MHVYFSGIGGTGIGPLSLIARQAGYEVSGSDKQDSTYIEYLRKKGLTDICIGQTSANIAELHSKKPIDWFVYSSAIGKENPNHPELVFVKENGIKSSKRDEFIVELLKQTNQRMIAIAGTHGKTTTTAMTIWMFKQLNIPVSYSVGAKLSFGDMGEYDKEAKYFVYEADEYDRNFLSFEPEIALIAGIDYDHPDIYPTREEYNKAFVQFMCQSNEVYAHQDDLERICMAGEPETIDIGKFTLVGRVNRANAQLVVEMAAKLTDKPVSELISIMNDFPGVSRRFERIVDGVYSDYAHTPEKIRGALQMAQEALDNHRHSRLLNSDGVQEANKKHSEPYPNTEKRVSEKAPKQSAENNNSTGNLVDRQVVETHEPGVVVVYEGLHNTRQHFIKEELVNLFAGIKKLYIVPSYLAREDESLEMLTPEKLCEITQNPVEREPVKLDDNLKNIITKHVNNSDLVLCLSAGGGGSLDEWLRLEFES